jgi:hypothetical protein
MVFASTATQAKQDKASARAFNIIRALDDERLFRPWFRGPSWDNWRVILKAAYALPMTSAELESFRTVAGDRDPPRQQVRELWTVGGRRSGKDSIASVIAAYSAALFNQQDRLRPGERALIACLACDRNQSRIILDYTKAFFSDIPMLHDLVVRTTAVGFQLRNSIDIEISTNNFKSVRGRPFALAILDECAFYASETSATPDVELYKAIVPGMATLDRSMLVGISTPYRRAGLLHQKYKDHFGKAGDVLVIQAPSTVLNPTLDPAIVARALEEDPAAARAEWLGEFRTDVGGWAEETLIESAVDYGVTVRPPRQDIAYQSFCDPSGGAKDSFAAAVGHMEAGTAVLDCVVEVKAPFNPTDATKHITDVLKSYRQTSTIGDKYAAQWVVDAVSKCGIQYRHSDRDRSAIYLDALPLFTSGRVRLLDNRKLVNQFASLERRTSPIGKDRVDHGPSGHDDLCNSAAGVLVNVTLPGPPVASFGTWGRNVSNQFGYCEARIREN